MKAMRRLYRFLSHQTHDGGSPFISVPKHLDPQKQLLMPLKSGEK